MSAVLDRLEIGTPLKAERLQVFPLHWLATTAGAPLDYQTLDAALDAGVLEITEVDESGSVPELRVVNKGDRMIFLLAGEQLIGAKQNRVLNTDIMVPARQEIPIPVSCVEQGRWSYKTEKFKSAGNVSHGKLRKAMSGQVFANLKTSAQPKSEQSAVWGEVDRKLTSMGSANESTALDKAYQDHNQKLSDIATALRNLPDHTCGAVFAINGTVVGVDVFDKPETLKRLYPKLVQSYGLDALEDESDNQKVNADVDAAAIKQWLTTVGQAACEQFASPGVGQDLRFKVGEAVGAGLLVDDRAVHIEVFA